MISPIFAAFGQTILMLLLGFVALFLILLVLVQRGRGGGLAGALGGMGGSSAFGAKAGDIFTKITAFAAMFWILLCIAASKMTPEQDSLIDTGKASTSAEASSMGAPPAEEEGDGDATASESTAAEQIEAPADSEPEDSTESTTESVDP
ncbi:MAG: preprotein translocase subunit SecG [Planctomycetota bacterium]